MSNVRRLSWFKMRNAVNGVAQLDIFGDIGGYGVNFPMFARQLESLGLTAADTLKIRINSDGGDVSQGFAIFQALALSPAQKEITVMGLAASMASVIFMAGDKRIMPANATLMIHNPVGQIVGESEEIISFGEGVGKMKDNIAAAYAEASGGKLSINAANKLMDRQSWIGAAEALKLGLATAVMGQVKIAAKFDLSRFHNAPESVGAKRLTKGQAMTKRKDENFDFEGDAETRAEMRTEIRADVLKQQNEITALCKIAGKPELAAQFVEDDLSLSDVVAELDKLAKGDGKNGKNGKGREARASTSRNARNGRGDEGRDEINARSAVATDGESNVPELNPMKIWDKWNKAGVAA
jgi:ATP-dependent Clp protease, protease subunit